MATQSGANFVVAIHRETAINVQATATGATQMRIISSPGLVLNRANIQSGEKRTDYLKTMPRLGYKSVTGSYTAELTVGGATDILLEALVRGTWSAATTTPFTSMTTIAIGTQTLTAAGGDFLAGTPAIRAGDIFYLTGTTVSGNNNVNARVVSVATLTIVTTTGAFTTLAATATGTIVRLKKVTNPATPTRYSHTVEQYYGDVDDSEIFTGCRIVGAKVSFRPGQMATIQYTFLGVDRAELTGASAPYFTSPSLTTGLDLIADDSTIRYNGAPIATITGFDIDMQITAKGEPVIGSFTTADIYDNDFMISGSMTMLWSDFSNQTLFDAETEFEVSILLQEPTGTPKACLSLFLPRVKLGGISAGPLGSDGAMPQTLPIWVGPKATTTGYDIGYVDINSSAP